MSFIISIADWSKKWCPISKFSDLWPMNPFNLHKKCDSSLSDILSRLNKPSSATKDVLEKLVGYLLNVDIGTDTQTILKAIKPLMGTPLKPLVNKILYFLLKRSKIPMSVQVPWIYHNFDSQDPYSKRIFEKYFDVKAVSKEFEGFLQWDDPLRDLACFLYLMKNSNTEHYFDVQKLQFQTYFEFDTLLEILEIIKGKDPIEFSKIAHQNDFQCKEDGYAKIAQEAFLRVRNVKSPLFLSRKYRILLGIYNFIDDSVYEEAAHLDCSILGKVIDKVDCNRLKASTVDQIAMILPRVENPAMFIITNVHQSMCIFDLIRQTNIEKSILLENREIFTPVANESLKRHCVTKGCMAKEDCSRIGKCDIDIQVLRGIFDLFTGKYRIIASSILGLRLSYVDFELNDIEETIEYAVEVFPKEFFLSRKFSASAIPFLKKYPEELSKSMETLEGLISNFSRTKRADVVKLIDDISMLRQFLGTFSTDDIKRLYRATSIDHRLKIVYLYYLRSEIEPFEVDYSQVFEHFFSKEFLRFLLSSRYSVDNFMKAMASYIKNLDLGNSILYTGFNFDDDCKFYYNLQHPIRDPALKVVLSVLETLALDTMLEALRDLLRIILYKPTRISKLQLAGLNTGSLTTKHLSSIRGMFDFGRNNFIVERYIRELLGKECIRLDASTLSINRSKAMDVILRYFRLSDKFFHNLNPSFLSNESLANVVDSIISRFSHVSNFSAALPIEAFSKPGDLEHAISSLTLSSTTIKNNDRRLLTTEETRALVEELFTKKETKSLLDFIYLIENDLILRDDEFRSERLGIYMPLINLVAEELSTTFINLYSFSKLESGSTDEAVLDFILDPIKGYRNSFWVLLVNALHRTRNVYISMFIEKMIIRHLEGSSSSYFSNNNIVSIGDYAKSCSNPELDAFALVFPLVYSKLKLGRTVNLESLIKGLARTEIDNGKVTFSKTNESYRLRLVYRADSINHEASIHIPLAFPTKKARIEFDHSVSKNAKFYHKLNELLSKTGKFIEILLLWKVDIDNHLAGYTECLICYFIMEPKYRTLPSFKCSNCANRYHEKCIYKWAAESRNKRCPLCRVELSLWPKS